STLSFAVKKEAAIRGVKLPAQFNLPDGWHNNYQSVFARLAKQANLTQELTNLEEASRQVAGFYNPLQIGTAAENSWDPLKQRWL
ncbi:MAG: hypothetical protein RR572_01850, partial [Raoultibacter sp.]